jgi:transposase-like protein
MGGKRYSTEQIIVKLRQAEIEMGRGVKVPEVCRSLGITEQTFYRWRKLNGAHLLPLVRAGVEFEDGRPAERNDNDQKEAA